MYILISGSSGLVGSELVSYLTNKGHGVVRLVRHYPKFTKDEMYWDPETGVLNEKEFKAFDAVIHLAGENILSLRWTKSKKASIRNSRVDGTTLLCQKLSALKTPPKILISASAAGYYGDQGDKILDESSSPGVGFLSGVCREWEGATKIAEQRGMRVIHLRTGVVLSEKGGALPKMSLPFKLGLGAKIGDGKQFMSWIALSDCVQIISFILEHASLTGPVNVVSPQPTTHAELTHQLEKIFEKKAYLTMPAFFLRLGLGQMAEELFLSSQRATPKKLLDAGYLFRYPDITKILEHIYLGK